MTEQRWQKMLEKLHNIQQQKRTETRSASVQGLNVVKIPSSMYGRGKYKAYWNTIPVENIPSDSEKKKAIRGITNNVFHDLGLSDTNLHREIWNFLWHRSEAGYYSQNNDGESYIGTDTGPATYADPQESESASQFKDMIDGLNRKVENTVGVPGILSGLRIRTNRFLTETVTTYRRRPLSERRWWNKPWKHTEIIQEERPMQKIIRGDGFLMMHPTIKNKLLKEIPIGEHKHIF